MTSSILLIILIVFLVIVSIFVLLLIVGVISLIHVGKNGAPYVPNDSKVIRESFKLASIGSNDTLTDLGSGDGRVLRLAIKEFDVKKAIGYELSLIPYLLSMFYQLISPTKVKRRMKINRDDLLKADLSKTTIVYIYLLPGLLSKVTPLLKKYKENNPEAKIVCPVFPIFGMKMKNKTKIYHPSFRNKVEIFLY